MADTFQGVTWALGQTCPLRSGDAYDHPARALGAVGAARLIAQYADGPADGLGIFGDVCVASCSLIGFRGFGSFPGGDVRDAFAARYPHTGFLVSERLASLNGVEGLRAMCGTCPANASRRGEPAQCAGWLYQDPSRVQKELKGIISRLGLADAVGEHFLETTPIWYGLWATSPLSSGAVSVLRKIMEALLEPNAIAKRVSTTSGSDPAALRAFLRATETAEAHGLPLFVSMAPPGHTDFGIHTIFAHCPRCKAEADVERWKGKAPTALRACDACGTVYSPAETESKEGMNDERPSLRDTLGPERFVPFAKEYLIAQGMTPEDAGRTIAEQEGRELERRRHMEETRLKQARIDAFLRDRIFAGLSPTYAPDGVAQTLPRFAAPEFAEVLRRCRALRVRVGSMMRLSPDGCDIEQHATGWLDAPEAILRNWLSAGFGGPFAAS